MELYKIPSRSEGNVVKRFEPAVGPMDIGPYIQKLIHNN